MSEDTTRGAMPRPSAMLGPAGRAAAGPISWPRILRDGEGNQSGANGGDLHGAPAPAAGTTSAGATPPAQPPATPPATGAEANLGEAGKRAIAAEREARETAERERNELRAELEQLRTAGQSEQERQLNQSRREAERARDAFWAAKFRTNVVEGALRGAGLTNDEAIQTALLAPRFANLKVDPETGVVEGVAEAVEQFKAAVPQLFASPKAESQPGPGGPWGGSEGGTSRREPANLGEAVDAYYAPSRR